MNIKVHSSELNRMMKTISQCIDDRQQRFGNIEISYDNNMLTIRGTDGQFSAVVSTAVLGGDGEKFCVDGTFFARACSMCSGEVSIITDEKFCTIKGTGRTRLPIVNAEVPKYKPVSEKNTTTHVKSDDFSFAYNSVSHAISADQSRIQLTGVLFEADETKLQMTALDGFRMAVNTVECNGDAMKIIIPGSFMKLIQSSTSPDETITIISDGKRVEATTEYMKITCGLLVGEFPDVSRIVPQDFKIGCLVNVDQIRNALRSSSILNSKNNLVKFAIAENKITVMSNSEEADYEETIDCETSGGELKIAFNQKYIMDTFTSVTGNEAIMKFNNSTSPCVIHGKEEKGFKLVLPVRVMG